ncbi:hypothetical protein KAW64_14745 [bacterium]|nr:hypothetical protein [bacterium]
MRNGTDCAALLRAYVRAWPLDIGGYEDGERHGFKFHTQSQRSGELHRIHRFPTTPMTKHSDGTWKNQLGGPVAYERARLQVKSWATGIPVADLEIQESLRPVYQPGLFTGGGA